MPGPAVFCRYGDAVKSGVGRGRLMCLICPVKKEAVVLVEESVKFCRNSRFLDIPGEIEVDVEVAAE
eukprot:14903731-Heterocapsa_arctica.AAC.1